MKILINFLSIIGFSLSLYFLNVRNQQKNKKYKAFCDLNNIISCSKAARSRYSSLFFLPNAVFGMIFYPLILLLTIFNQFMIIFYLSLIASLFSIILIFISIKIKTLCPVCTLIYVISFFMLYFSYLKL